MSEPLHRELSALLASLEQEMALLELCSASVPSPEALASTAPFCVDSLSFPQWLQFIFIPGLRRIIDQRQLLPRECQVAPMAEMYFRLGSSDGAAVVALLQRIDRLLSSPPLDR